MAIALVERHVAEQDLLGDALADEVAEIRLAASVALGQVGTAEPMAMVKTVTPYLESPDSSLRLLAVRTLGGMPVTSIESHLLLALKDFYLKWLENN